MSRFDKYEPLANGFRARLEETWLEADVGVCLAVAVNASGHAVKGNISGTSGLKGVVALGQVRSAGHPIDVMTCGEILDVADDEVTGTLAAGINIYAVPGTGALTTAAAAGVNIYVGHMVEIDRLIVRFAQSDTDGV